MMASDSELLNLMAQGRAEAFSEFYDRLSPRVFGLLLRILKNQTDAEDVLQDTFLQIWNRSKEFDPNRSRPEVWAMMLARSRSIDHLRKKQRHPTTSAMEAIVPHTDVDPLEKLESKQIVHTSLDRLPMEQQIPIRLAYYEGLTHEEIARKLSIPLGTIKTRIRTGMIHLRGQLEQREEWVKP